MSTLSMILIIAGLFLAGGVYSFWKQQFPKSVLILMSIAAGMCLVAGLMRVEALWG